MTEESAMTKIELHDAIENGWKDLQDYLSTLTYEQVTIPTDPAGWTAKDHLAHLAVWEDSVNALFDHVPRWQQMGIDHDLWNTLDWDRINAVIQQRYHDMPLREVAAMFFGIHERLVEKIESLSDADLQRSYKDYQPDSSLEAPAIHWCIIDTYQHYDEHKDYIDKIARQYVTSVANLLTAIQTGWNELHAYLRTLSEAQVTQPTDAAGWTVKDHVMHMVIWEDAMNALLERRDVRAALDIEPETWKRNNIDEINAIIQRRYRDLSWAEVRRKFQQVHEELIGRIHALEDADLLRPHRDFQPDSTDENPVLGHLVGNSFGHYAEHTPWIVAIVKSS